MATPSGLSAQIGFGAESTWATRVTPTRFVEMLDESMELNDERIESSALRTGSSVQRSDRWQTNKKGVSGDVNFEVPVAGMGLLLEHMLGTVATTTPGGATTARDHTATIGSLTGKGFTVQVGKTSIDGTVRPFDYTGCKVSSWEIACDIDGFLTCRLGLDGYDELTDQSLASASYPSTGRVFSFKDAAISVGGSSACVRSFSLSGDNTLGTDRRCLGESRKKEQLEAGMRAYGGTFEVDFEDLTHYNRFVNGTVFAFSATFTGPEIESGFNYTFTIILPAVRADGETPKVSGPDTLVHAVPFTVLDNNTDEPITMVARNGDSSA